VKRKIARRANLPQGDGHRVWQQSSRARATLLLPMLAVSASATF
jgi:hypothetical protein